MIVATAGHIDHGKTSLVKALTGVDTDRLPEEKARGLSIDLGFAYSTLENGDILGFVDVPGHERFVRNMLAGVSGIDLALLVVAADDGPMPQTEEHLAILDLLGAREAMVALTKIDRVGPERVTEATVEIELLLEETALAGAPIYPVSAMTGDGMDLLKLALLDAAEQVQARATAGYFRLAIDRAFTVPGAGLVVTGTAFSGSVSVSDSLILSPQGQPVRVRGLRAQNKETETAAVGQRVAVNIAGDGLRKAGVSRGNWLLSEAIHAPTNRLDARLRVLPTAPRALRHWTPVHFHTAASDVTGRLAILAGGAVDPGGSAIVQLVLDEPVCALHGDKFVLRDQSARRTLAGGSVIDPFAPSRGRARPARRALLEAMEPPEPSEALAHMLETAPFVDLFRFATSRNLKPDQVASLDVPFVKLGTDESPLAIAPERWTDLSKRIETVLTDWHRSNPDRPAMALTSLRRGLSDPDTGLPAEPLIVAATQALSEEGKIAFIAGGICLPRHRPTLAGNDAALWKQVQPLLLEGGTRPPRVRELAAELSLKPEAMEAFLKRAARIGLVMRVAANRYFPPLALLELGEIAEALDTDGTGFTAADYRDRSGIGRNVTIELLEYFDKVGLTQRRGETRVIRKSAQECFGTLLSGS